MSSLEGMGSSSGKPKSASAATRNESWRAVLNSLKESTLAFWSLTIAELYLTLNHLSSIKFIRTRIAAMFHFATTSRDGLIR